MMYYMKTGSTTPPGRYHVRQTVSHWKNRQNPTEDRRQKTEDRRQKPNHAMLWAPPKQPLMPLEASNIGLCQNSVVDFAAGFNSLDFQSTTPPKVTHSPVVSWLQLEHHWFPYAASRSKSWVLLSVSGSELERLLRGDVTFRFTNKVEVLIFVSHFKHKWS